MTSAKNLWEIESLIKSRAAYEFRSARIRDTCNSSGNVSNKRQFQDLHDLDFGNEQAR